MIMDRICTLQARQWWWWSVEIIVACEVM